MNRRAGLEGRLHSQTQGCLRAQINAACINKWLCLIAVTVALTGCLNSGAAIGIGCGEELAALTVESSATIDVALLVPDIVEKMGGESMWDAISVIDTDCPVPVALPDHMPPPVPSSERQWPAAKPVQKVRLPNVAGVVFLYPSQGVEEVMTGLAAALVEYRDDGTPGRVYKASELLHDEGWARHTSSTLMTTAIERCDQEIEYFTYSPEGDITGELPTPRRMGRFCEQIMLLSP